MIKQNSSMQPSQKACQSQKEELFRLLPAPPEINARLAARRAAADCFYEQLFDTATRSTHTIMSRQSLCRDLFSKKKEIIVRYSPHAQVFHCASVTNGITRLTLVREKEGPVHHAVCGLLYPGAAAVRHNLQATSEQ